MHDADDPELRPEQDGLRPARRLVLHPAPPLRLAGADEDEGWEPNVVRGID